MPPPRLDGSTFFRVTPSFNGDPAIAPVLPRPGPSTTSTTSTSTFETAPAQLPVALTTPPPPLIDAARGAEIAAAGASSIQTRMQGHVDAIEQTGIGTYYGDHSSFKTMTPDERAAWIAANQKPGTTPGTPSESSCIGWAMENVGAAYRAAGLGDRWNEIARIVAAKGSKGTDLAIELKKDGWESVYWNPDAKNPSDGNAEHSFSALQVARGRGYYGVAVDHTVLNYRPTAGKSTVLDTSGIEKLAQVPFFFGLAKGGRHTFVGRNGQVNEFHWSQMPNGTNAIEETPLKDWGWNSGLIMIPPGTWPH